MLASRYYIDDFLRYMNIQIRLSLLQSTIAPYVDSTLFGMCVGIRIATYYSSYLLRAHLCSIIYNE